MSSIFVKVCVVLIQVKKEEDKVIDYSGSRS